MKKHLIEGIMDNSIAWELGIEKNDYLVSINGKEIEDALDYYLFANESYIEVEILKADSDENIIFEIDKDDDEELGLVFDNGLMDEYKSCNNKCIFCFIDQLPKGMRETMYFKDDDARLSFLQGNYITLTNIKEKDIERIIRYNLSPMNISVHTMNMELRQRMLHNRFADRIIGYMDRLNEANIVMNAQVVLCKGINDGEELAYTIEQLEKYIPNLLSLTIVPVGISQFREGLEVLEPFTKADALQIIETVEKWQKLFYTKYQMHFVHASDEFYFLANKDMPTHEQYDGYQQLENGVGMTRVLLDSFEQCYNRLEPNETEKVIAIATGTLMADMIKTLVHKFNNKCPNIKVNVYGIRNDFFGEKITVSGLLTGVDIINQLKNQTLGETLLLPAELLKADEAILLDDITVSEIEAALNVKVKIVENDGFSLIEAILN
jgi:putative radical SAM enzyme (TIGR03279 family)